MVWTEIIVSFLRFHSRTEFQINLLTMRATPFLQWVLAHSSGYNGDSLWWMLSDLWFPKERILLEDQGLSFSHSELCVAQVILHCKNDAEKLLTKTSEGGWRLTHLLVWVGLYILFQRVTSNRKVLPDPLSHMHLKITGSFWTILLRTRNMCSSEIHCCYIIIVSENYSVVSNCLSDPWTVAHQAPLSMEFSKEEY